MSRGRAIAALLLTVAVIPASAVQAEAQGVGDAEADDPGGASALRQLADADGHHATLLTDQFQPPGSTGVLFIIEPENAFKAQEAYDLARWVSGGGVLVYAAENSDPELEGALGIDRSEVSPGSETGRAGTPVLAGVNSVDLGSSAPFAAPTTGQAAFLLTADGRYPVGITAPMGHGRFFALASSLALGNALIGTADNNRMAADLLAAAGPAATVSFDQFHHGGGAGESSSLAWVATPWGLAIVLLTLSGFGLLALRGRAFGPPIPLRPAAEPSSADFTSAVGAMLRRAGARHQATERLVGATRTAVSEQVGLRGGGGAGQVEVVLRQRSPELAAALSRAAEDAAMAADEGEFARAAGRLHELARPVLGSPGIPVTHRRGRR